MNPIENLRLSGQLRAGESAKRDPASSVRTSPAEQVNPSRDTKTGNAISTHSPGNTAGTQAPVDQERVAQIRQAIKQGTYPILPARIADAMIAAGYLLQYKG
ncbi:MAG: flagellar biosynthesis anti-sigma factor FlgM [Sphingomonadaceae bacterium]